jgi:hydrogenase maturation factor HypF (carbamoyltransferase family)
MIEYLLIGILVCLVIIASQNYARGGMQNEHLIDNIMFLKKTLSCLDLFLFHYLEINKPNDNFVIQRKKEIDRQLQGDKN